MSDSVTPRLGLPMLAAGQAQKELYHNEALSLIDLCLNGHALEVGANTPPDMPEPGQSWIIGNAPEGDWAGNANQIAGWTLGGWRFVSPAEGMRLWCNSTVGFILFRDGNWQSDQGYGPVIIAGDQIIGERLEGIAEPSGGTVVDAEARAALTAVLFAMRTHGLIA